MTEPLLQVRDLRVHFPLRGRGGVAKAVDGVSFDVPAGRTVALVGESGCGKSTTARLLMQLMAPDAGTLVFDGEGVGEHAQTGGMSLKDYRRQVQMVFQDSYASLNPRLTIEDSISFGPRVHGVREETARRRAHDLLARVGLEPARFAGRYPHELSGGQRQRVNIARALALEPRLLLLDEVLAGLVPTERLPLIELLRSLASEHVTVVFIEHVMAAVMALSQRVLVLHEGRVLAEGTPDEVTADRKVVEAYLGEEFLIAEA